MEKFICLSEKRSLEDCAAVAEACLGEMESEAEVEGIIQRAANEVAEAAAEQRGGDGGDGDLTIEIQVREEECSTALGQKVGQRLREFFRRVEAKVAGNSRNKIHQT